MSRDLRDRLFDSYRSTHVANLDPVDGSRQTWFREYVERYYLPHLPDPRRTSVDVLEIGSSSGELLAALHFFGFRQLSGIDRSPEDVERARQLLPSARLECVDALDFLKGKARAFDVVIAKAVLEHIPKSDVLELLESIAGSLRDAGIVVIDVPNMGWLFASHERYMDFTHETGFTRESLRQVLLQVFQHVEILAVDHLWSGTSIEKLKRRFARLALGKLLMWADGQGATKPIWARSLVAIASR